MQEALLPRESLVIGGSYHYKFRSLIDVLISLDDDDTIDSNEHEIHSLMILLFTDQWLAMPRGKVGIPFHHTFKQLFPGLEASKHHGLIYGEFYLRPRNIERSFVYANQA